MIMNKISTETRGTTGTEKDATTWANLLDDFLGPENDVYARLLNRSEPEKQETKPS